MFDGGEGGISSIQVQNRNTKSNSIAMVYAVYTLIQWVREGKVGGLLRAPLVQGELGLESPPGPRARSGPHGPHGMPGPQREIGFRGPIEPRTAEGEARNMTIRAGNSMLRWNRVLKSLSWDLVRPWVSQVVSFLRNVELREGQPKVLLLTTCCNMLRALHLHSLKLLLILTVS